MSLPNYYAVGYYNDTLSVYYSGTDTLQWGYCLNWDVAATVAATDPKTRLGHQCVKPLTANLMAFAGVVGPSMAGRVGPANVDIIPWMKNRFVSIYTNLSMTAFTTIMGTTNNSYYLGSHSDANINANLVGIAAETADTSSTNQAVKVILFK